MKVLTEQMIRDAMERTLSNNAAAKYLRVSLPTYRKYASSYLDQESGSTLYDLHENRYGKGISKRKIQSGVKTIKEALENGINVSNHNIDKIKATLLHFGLLPHKCSKCGFKERRILDSKVPLLLWFKDGDKFNVTLPNLTFYCYNCYFLYVSDIFTKRQVKLIEDATAPVVQTDDIDWEIDESDIEQLREDMSGAEFISKF